jgi:hypothetical protein
VARSTKDFGLTAAIVARLSTPEVVKCATVANARMGAASVCVGEARELNTAVSAADGSFMDADEHNGEEELLARLRTRAADPMRRVDSLTNAFYSGVQSLDLGSLLKVGRSLVEDLRVVVRSGPDGPPADIVARAEQLGAAMHAPPVAEPAPAPCDRCAVDDAEADLGFSLPDALRRIYTDVANGGIGPGYGIVGVRGGWTDEHGKSLVDLYRLFDSDGAEDDLGEPWPARLLPLCHLGDGVYDCVDARDPAGPVVELDLGNLDEDGAGDAFTPLAPSLMEWLEAWLDETT